LAGSALRERKGDILPLATRMLAGATVRNHRPGLRLPPEASSALLRYRWPGNIRELRNVIERAVVLCPSDVVTPEYLPDIGSDRSQASSTTAALIAEARRHRARTNHPCNGRKPNARKCAHKLGINVVTLWRRRKRYRLDSTPHLLRTRDLAPPSPSIEKN